MDIDNPQTFDHIIAAGAGGNVRVKRLIIPEWNVNNGAAPTIDPGVAINKIVGLSGRIRNDANTIWAFNGWRTGSDYWGLAYNPGLPNLIATWRVGFVSVDWDGLGFDRGEMLMWYLE